MRRLRWSSRAITASEGQHGGSLQEQRLALATRAVKLATNFDIKPGVGMWDMMKRMTPETMAKIYQHARWLYREPERTADQDQEVSTSI